MSDQQERAWTVTPEMGLKVLEDAKEGIYNAFEGQGDSPASAVSTALVGYRNATSRIASLETDLKAWKEASGVGIDGTAEEAGDKIDADDEERERLKTELAEARDDCLWWAGEGLEEHPSIVEWRELSALGDKRTDEQTQRIGELAMRLRADSDDVALCKERDTLRAHVSELTKQGDRIYQDYNDVLERLSAADVFLEKVRCRPHMADGRETWNPGTLQVWKDIHAHFDATTPKQEESNK